MKKYQLSDQQGHPKIISLTDYAQYRKTLSKLIKQIDGISGKIHDKLFCLACQGKWKEWDKAQPIGTEIYIDDEMLRNTGDKNIDLLWEVLDKIGEVKERM